MASTPRGPGMHGKPRSGLIGGTGGQLTAALNSDELSE
jgi:hypothetical protein